MAQMCRLIWIYTVCPCHKGLYVEEMVNAECSVLGVNILETLDLSDILNRLLPIKSVTNESVTVLPFVLVPHHLSQTDAVFQWNAVYLAIVCQYDLLEISPLLVDWYWLFVNRRQLFIINLKSSTQIPFSTTYQKNTYHWQFECFCIKGDVFTYILSNKQ
jgi:hypothetical protein